MKPTAEHKH